MANRVEKFDANKKAAYLELLRTGGRRMASARAVGINPRTVEKHMRRYPGFAQLLSEAEMEANEFIENALYKAAREGNVTAIQVWLYNRAPSRWKDQRNMKVTVGDGDIDEAIETELARLSASGQDKTASSSSDEKISGPSDSESDSSDD